MTMDKDSSSLDAAFGDVHRWPDGTGADHLSSCAVYPEISGLDCELFALSEAGLRPDQHRKALDNLLTYERMQQANFLGYQANQKLDYSELAAFLDIHVNNIGDPFASGNFTVNSKVLERAVLDYYARLWQARWPSRSCDPESYWGYVLSMGSTEGNFYGLWNARDYLAGKFLLEEPASLQSQRIANANGEPTPSARRLIYQQAAIPAGGSENAFMPIAFYSQDTHYSIIKMMRVLGIKSFFEEGTAKFSGDCPITSDGKWPQEVPSVRGLLGPGSIDPSKLKDLVEFFASRGYPILISLNYGTTFKGAYDDVRAAIEPLIDVLKRCGLFERKVFFDPDRPERFDLRNGFWVHVDGALGAAFMPFIEIAHRRGLIAERGPDFDFRLPYVNSLCVSGHKWIGAPWPCGVYMTKVKYQLRPPDDPEYIGSPDTTFAGSRNGFSAIILWNYLAKTSHDAQIEKALAAESIAAYAEGQLLQLQERLQVDLWIARTPLSLTVRFRAANHDLVRKYSLSGETMAVGSENHAYNHIFAMDHVTRERIDALITDLAQPGSLLPNNPSPLTPAHASVVTSETAGVLIHVPHAGRGFR
jgi:histidine decarboxylase